jgi:hypothetical protein
MFLREFTAATLVVSLTWLTAGCGTVGDSSLTGRLWESSGRNRCLPASHPNLKLYRAVDRDDVLVTYDELRETNDSTRRRAFFFKPKVRRLEQRKKPRFIRLDKMGVLNLLPVPEAGQTNAPIGEVVFVRVSGEGREFTLVWHGSEIGPYVLPTYLDNGGRAKRMLLTPLANLGDAAMVVIAIAVVAGVVVGYGYLYSLGHEQNWPRQ